MSMFSEKTMPVTDFSAKFVPLYNVDRTVKGVEHVWNGDDGEDCSIVADLTTWWEAEHSLLIDSYYVELDIGGHSYRWYKTFDSSWLHDSLAAHVFGMLTNVHKEALAAIVQSARRDKRL